MFQRNGKRAGLVVGTGSSVALQEVTLENGDSRPDSPEHVYKLHLRTPSVAKIEPAIEWLGTSSDLPVRRILMWRERI